MLRRELGLRKSTRWDLDPKSAKMLRSATRRDKTTWKRAGKQETKSKTKGLSSIKSKNVNCCRFRAMAFQRSTRPRSRERKFRSEFEFKSMIG